MRHAFASLLLQEGAPITYVSQQLGHRDRSITPRVYAHCLPALVNRLDDAASDVTQASPATPDEERSASGRSCEIRWLANRSSLTVQASEGW